MVFTVISEIDVTCRGSKSDYSSALELILDFWEKCRRLMHFHMFLRSRLRSTLIHDSL
jgi:hypothetical protein